MTRQLGGSILLKIYMPTRSASNQIFMRLRVTYNHVRLKMFLFEDAASYKVRPRFLTTLRTVRTIIVLEF